MSYQIGRKKNWTWKSRILRNLVTEMIIHGQIKTTHGKAKELRKHVDKVVGYAKKNTLHSRRLAARFLRNMQTGKEKQTALQKLFDEIGPKYKDRLGGYTRILKIDNRRGDNALEVIIKFV